MEWKRHITSAEDMKIQARKSAQGVRNGGTHAVPYMIMISLGSVVIHRCNTM